MKIIESGFKGHHTRAGVQGHASGLRHPLFSQSSIWMFDVGHFVNGFSCEVVTFLPTVRDTQFAAAAILCSPQCLTRVEFWGQMVRILSLLTCVLSVS